MNNETNAPSQTCVHELTEPVELMIQTIEQLGYTSFQQVIALGHWPDNTPLTDQQKPMALQAMLIYEHRHIPLESRTGFVHKGNCQS